MLQKLRNIKGFSLIEVLIVITIIAIFTVIIIQAKSDNKTQPTNPKPAIHQTTKNKKL